MRVQKLLTADDANHLPVISLRSSSCLGEGALRESSQLLHKRIVQLNQSRRRIFFKVFDLEVPGIDSITGDFLSSQAIAI